MKKTLLFLLVTIMVIAAAGCGGGGDAAQDKSAEFDKNQKASKNCYFLASTEAQVPVYQVGEEGLVQVSTLSRGMEVKKASMDGNEKDYEAEYCKIKAGDEEYLVLKSNTATLMDDTVQEKDVWVRTPATLYMNNEDSTISGYGPKGSKMTVLGYDKINPNGYVNMYNVNYNDVNCWVYGKYMTGNEESANAVNEQYTSIHRGRTYKGRDLRGGDPATLDYYPYERTAFEDNPVLEYSNAMFITFWMVPQIDDYLAVASENGVNAIVLDIKSGEMAYPSEVCKNLCPSSYGNNFLTVEQYKEAVDKIKNAGMYAIGRIVTFKDEHYAADHPDQCISTSSSTTSWPSAFSRNVWYYNVELAKEAVRMFGFNEIQFDYMRFPTNSYELTANSSTDFKNYYNESLAQALQGFAFYACDELHKEGVYVSGDVFGECSGDYVTAYGQYWPALSNILDATSSMPYLDHFSENPSDWKNPYQTMYKWAKECAVRQTEIPTPSIARTWITCYNTPYWHPDTRCDANYLLQQIKALKDAGLTGGFMPWNGNVSLEKYREVAPAWHDYQPGAAADSTAAKPAETKPAEAQASETKKSELEEEAQPADSQNVVQEASLAE